MYEVNPSQDNYRPWGMEINQFCTLMHLAQFAGYIIPLGGLILPILMWTTNKDQSALVDEHGKNIVNWIISSFIYIFISIILVFFVIGVFSLFAVVIGSFIFTIIGAVKASNREVYKYPMAITFIK